MSILYLLFFDCFCEYLYFNKSIRCPEILDLAPFMSGTRDLPIYRLYGVVVHMDIMNAAFSSHCVCYVKNLQRRWFKVDDSVVCLSFHYLYILRDDFFVS